MRYLSFRMLSYALLCYVLGGFPSVHPASNEVAQIFGRSISQGDLVAPAVAEAQKGKLAADAYVAWLQKEKNEKLRTLVWQAVFQDFAKQQGVEPTTAEIDSQISSQRRFMKEDKLRRAKERERLVVELKSPNLTEAQRKLSQQYLDTLLSLEKHDAAMAQERRTPEQEKMWANSDRRVAQVWVKNWKVNQALYRTFGGRIIFQQAGWEPIDAYRKVLEQYQARKAFVVHDLASRDAVYSYFKFNFVYADETKAKFYFEKPYWERTAEEMKAAGF